MAGSLDALAEPLRTQVKRLVQEAGAGRVTWTSTRRSYQEQAALRIKNGCPDVMSAPASACRVPTAIPGTSKHETGEAIDFTNTRAVLSIVERLAPKYHLGRTVPGEPWHYEYTGDVADLAEDAGQGVGIGDLPWTDPAGMVKVLGAFVNPLDALGTIGTILTRLLDGALWLRVLEVAAGAVLVVVGLGLLSRDLIASVLPGPAGRIVKAAT